VVLKLLNAATKDGNGAWRMDLQFKFEDIVDEENEQEFNANQSKDEMSDCESDSDEAHVLEVNKC